MPVDLSKLKAECYRHSAGKCSLAMCFKRDNQGVRSGHPNCMTHDIIVELEALRDLVDTMIDNDPNADVADAAVMIDVWRQRAREIRS